VIGSTAFTLAASPDPDNANLSRIEWSDGRAFNVERGELAALLNARDEEIPALLQGLDDLANTLLVQVNALHNAGFGLTGASGLDFFSAAVPDPPVLGSIARSFQVNAGVAGPEDIAATAPDPATPGIDPGNPGDGSQAGLIAGLRTALLMGAGTRTLGSFYTDQVTTLGQDIRRATSDAGAHSLVVANLDAQRESVSGVSLDEEAANLVKSQRAYEAAARLMTALDEMVDRIINGLGRVGL
jgi:flagellar hook-associated protein 1 FlgK